jgi:hypothetical protein
MLGHGRALFLKMLQELAQGLDGVGGADGSTLGDNMYGIDDAHELKNARTICLI